MAGSWTRRKRKNTTIGLYGTEKEAEDALVVFMETGQKPPSTGLSIRRRGEGTIHKRKTNGKFRARIRINGKRKSKDCNSITECEAFIKRQKELAGGSKD